MEVITATLPNGDVVPLTQDQTNGYNKFADFILDNEQNYLVIDGFGGTGKTVLIRKIIETYDHILKSMDMLTGKKSKRKDIYATATTNKAVDNLSHVFGDLNIQTSTIHKLLNLRVHKDYKANKTKLLQTKNAEELIDSIIIIDEFSKIHDEKYNDVHYFIDKLVRGTNTKIIYVGDRWQQTDFFGNPSYISRLGFETIRLTETKRADGNSPIGINNQMLRDAIRDGSYGTFTMCEDSVIHVDQETFLQMAIDDFTNGVNAKVLAWTNKTVNEYNRYIKEAVTGNGSLTSGDFAQVNSFVQVNKTQTLATDQEIFLTSVSGLTEHKDYPSIKGYWVKTPSVASLLFLPLDQSDRKKLETKLRKDNDIASLMIIDSNWVDLRPSYASTVDKSQGSTYEHVYIDLNDIGKCKMFNAQSRMLGVANSRASKKVIFTGDFG